MILGDLDLGPLTKPVGGGVVQTNEGGQTTHHITRAQMYAARAIAWALGAELRTRKETVYVEDPSGRGGGAAASQTALRYLVAQIQEISETADWNPVYVQWRSGGGVLNADREDGWWLINSVQPHMGTEAAGWAAVDISATLVAPGFPADLRLGYSGAALSTGYAGAATPLLSFPVGSSVPATVVNRTGAEGVIPLSQLPLAGTTNPAPFAPPATLAGLHTGRVRVYDNIVAGSGPPTNGAYVSPNWVEVFGTAHVFDGDCILTNGLLLLRFQKGTANSPEVWLWDTNLSAWNQIGAVQYQDNAGGVGSVRSITLDRVGQEECRVRLTVSSAAGNFAMLKFKLQRGQYHCYLEFWPIGYANTSKLALSWSTAAPYATGFTEGASGTTFPLDFGTTLNYGYFGVQGSPSNSPIFGFLYQNIPGGAADQGYMSSSTLFGHGDSNGPAANNFSLYGIWAAPYSGAPAVATARGIAQPIWQQFLFDRLAVWTRG